MNYFRKIFGVLSITALTLPMFVVAQSMYAESLAPSEKLEYYQYVSKVPNYPVPVPTTVQIRFATTDESKLEEPVVFEKSTEQFIPASLKVPQQTNLKPSISISRNSGTRTTGLNDGDRNTFYTVEAYPDGVQRGDTWISTVSLNYTQSVEATEAIFALDPTGPQPSKITVTADGTTIVPWQEYVGEIISFGKSVTARRFQIQFEHTSEIRISEVDVPYATDRFTYISFLMQPNESYEIYTSPIEGAPYAGYTSVRNYGSNTGQVVGAVEPTRNELYWNGDIDGDGIPVSGDNCAAYPNADQADLDQNGIGDACEDFDNDGVVNAIDNCPDRPNRYQKDTDDDGLGDECDDEESRLTEQYKWVPFVGILIAAAVLIGLFISVTLAARKFKEEESENIEETNSEEPPITPEEH